MKIPGEQDLRWLEKLSGTWSIAAFRPHVTLGGGTEHIAIEPFEFEACTIAIFHLGRFCACRAVFELIHTLVRKLANSVI